MLVTNTLVERLSYSYYTIAILCSAFIWCFSE